MRKINEGLNTDQKGCVASVGFGGLLEVKCNNILEKLSLWLVNNFDTNKFELVIRQRGTIKVDDVAVKRVLGLPMGANLIDYEKKSYSETFIEFYKLFGHENDQNAPTFVEVEKWLRSVGKELADDKWLKVWLMFAISSFLCPTSSTKLCVRAFHSIAIIEEIQGYNWCKLIVDRLIKGIADFKNGERKFLSGCLFFLTVCMLNFSHILLFPVFFLQDLTICISPPANIIPGFT